MYYIADSHTDFLTELKTKEERENYIKSLSLSPLKLLSCAVFTTDENLSVDKILSLKNEIKTLDDSVKLLFSVEDIGSVNAKTDMERLIENKPISCTLTWNYDNQYSGGTFSNNGLTQKGIQTIELLENNNIFVDTAHLNRKAFWQVCKYSKRPIFNSHSNIYTLRHHKRNLTDKQIQKIVDSDGYMGITIYNAFVSNKKRISSYDIAKQFDYLIKKFGYKHFGFGTDLYGIDKQDLPYDIANYNDLAKVIQVLENMGHSKDVIEHISYKNFYNFLKRNSLV